MTIMADKGRVRRDESARSHLYSAVHPESVVQNSLLKDLMRRAFGGSAVQLVQSAIDGDAASADELDQIAQMIAEAKAQPNEAASDRGTKSRDQRGIGGKLVD